MELNYQYDDLILQTTPYKINGRISTNNQAPPLITLVSHEARTVTFESSRIFKDKDADYFGFSNYTIHDAWLHPLRDSMHLN
jgi:hypothetical protein